MGKIRIISGQWRGRQLPVLDQDGLRPTSDRVRETLFNWLMPILQGSRCLDCFSGSGALGFEAASRFANEVVLLEKNALVAKQLKQNIASLNAAHIQLFQTDTLQWLNKPASPFDVVFVDPPFGHDLLDKTVHLLETKNWLTEKAFIYVECGRNETVNVPASWRLHRELTTKEVISRLYQRHLLD